VTIVRREKARSRAVPDRGRAPRPGVSVVLGIANQGVDVNHLDSLLAAQVDSIRAHGVSAEELAKAKNTFRAQFIANRVTTLSKAEELHTTPCSTTRWRHQRRPRPLPGNHERRYPSRRRQVLDPRTRWSSSSNQSRRVRRYPVKVAKQLGGLGAIVCVTTVLAVYPFAAWLHKSPPRAPAAPTRLRPVGFPPFRRRSCRTARRWWWWKTTRSRCCPSRSASAPGSCRAGGQGRARRSRGRAAEQGTRRGRRSRSPRRSRAREARSARVPGTTPDALGRCLER